MVLRKLDLQKINEIGPLSYTAHKKKKKRTNIESKT